MARFSFRLQTVLDYKQRLEELAQVELARCRSAQEREEQALRSLAETQARAVAQLESQRGSGRLDVAAVQLGAGYLDLLAAQVQRQSQVVERVQRQTEAKRQEAVSRMQERQTLERLRQRQHAAYLKDLARREARLNDELAVLGYRRTGGEGGRER
jgi:flagellar FliJ protein